MNKTSRRGFLALIPSLSAIPLIGSNIIQEEKRVIIENPKPDIIETPNIQDFRMDEIDVVLIDRRTGKEIGKGFLTTVNTEAPMMHLEYRHGFRGISIEAHLNNFFGY